MIQSPSQMKSLVCCHVTCISILIGMCGYPYQKRMEIFNGEKTNNFGIIDFLTNEIFLEIFLFIVI